MKKQAVIVKAKDCGMEVYRLLMWEDGKLVYLGTHMSRAGAATAYAYRNR